MWTSKLIFWALIPLLSCSVEQRFPPWFKFGASSSSYQVEGAWNVSDKSESKWDHLTHTLPKAIEGHQNGDVACDSYHQWKRDIEMVSKLGLQFYRFSINWPRLFPNGYPTKISNDGKRYYNNLINGLLRKGIEPVVTLHHYELPQIFDDFGGWTNPLMPDWFAEYARAVFTLFADRVKTWITINEPQMECEWYFAIVFGPEHDIEKHLCIKYILLAHAKAWRIYDKEFRHKYNGKLSITNLVLWLAPYSLEDKQLTETARQFVLGLYTHPIYSKEGGWPPAVQNISDTYSRQLGYTRPRLQHFTKEEINLIKGTYDFFAMNYYSSRLVRAMRPWESLSGFIFTAVPEINALFDIDPSWQYGFSKYMPVNPVGIRQQMHWIKKQYGNIEVLVTENGFSSTGSNLNDDERITFIKDHLEQVLTAINEGINVTGYASWSLMDSFEWTDGYTSKFGLYEVDFSDRLRKRTPRKSAHYYSNVIRNRSLLAEHFNFNKLLL